ncbi:hypothetical protein DNTS_021432 [Danionella cerebrum]|uniref:VWFA domain-containing protein n=1 Tax=Danionella cerebrum TaxID=2873325 RepID=A0A553R161_9TELE|nr:hypothetical protein DNTS_021432 [Danionella translucida]
MVSPSAVVVFVLWVSLFSCSSGFKIFPSEGSFTHQQITEQAFLRKMAEVCRDVAKTNGQDFTLAINSKLTPAIVQRACSNSYSTTLKRSAFDLVIAQASLSNAAVDRKQFSSAPHFDNEDFKKGRELITNGIAAVKVSIKNGNYLSARTSLGTVCHTLQDFYSHSNWVELGSSAPFSTLLKPELPLNNLAGKCSHGSYFDQTSSKEPTGGINKDDISSEHGFLHHRAANMAINATMEMLEEIRLAIGDQAYLRLMGLNQTSILGFVVDITGLLSTYIEQAKKALLMIIDLVKGTAEEPSEYNLVTFTDQDFGPLMRTNNADKFKEMINSLSASNDSNPGMCLSALLLAVTRVPPSSDIFVFTDGAAKDAKLKSTVETMIQSSMSKVTFLLTSSLSSRSQQNMTRSLSQGDIQLYRDLTHFSGGQTIEVTNSTLYQATVLIADAITAGQVTVLHVERNSAKTESFLFVLDSSLSNVTVLVTGDSAAFTLYSPTGTSQSDSMTVGPLGSILTVGSLKRVQLNSSQTGEWKISITSTSSFSLRVTGQSSVDVLVYFVEISQGGHSGASWGQSYTRPIIGQNATLFVSVSGGSSVTVSDVLLIGVSGSNIINGSIKAVGATDFLVNVDRIPDWLFMVQIKGQLNDSSKLSPFQRQSPTQLKGSRITLTAQSQNVTEAGVTLRVNFTVACNTSDGNYTIRALNDQGFSVSVLDPVLVLTGGSAQGSITLTTPSDTESGTDITLTIEAEAPGSTDLNYATLKITVSTANTVFSDRCSLCFSLFCFLFYQFEWF